MRSLFFGKIVGGGDLTPKAGIGRSLTWLVLAGILPIIAFSCGMAWLVIHRQQLAAEAELSSTTRALSVAIDRELESQLAAMAIVGAVHSLDTDDLGRFTQWARRVLAERPAWLDVVLVDPRSYLIVGGALPIPTPAPTSSSPAAIDQVVATGKPVIVGAFARGKIIDRPMILLMAPVIRDGVVRYVMTVVLDQGAISSVLAAQHLPANWTGAVVDAGMRLAGRSRKPEDFVGRPATLSVVTAIVAAESGMFEAVNQEGDKIETVFSRSPVTGWSVVIGIPADEIGRPIARTVMMVVAAGAGLVALAVVFASLVGRTIVARRRAYEGALEERERHYRSLFTNAKAIMLLLDPANGAIVDANSAAIDFYGYTIDRLKTMHIWDINVLNAQDSTRVMAGVLEAAAGHLELRHCLADGAIRDIEAHVGPLEIASRCLLLAIIHDITDRKGAEAARQSLQEDLRQSEERFRSLVEGTTDWVWESDADHCFSWLSKSFDHATDVPASEILGRRRWDLAAQEHEIDAALWQAHMEDLRAHRTYRDFRYWLKSSTGQLKWISVSGSPRFDADGVFLGYRGSGSDISAEATAALRLKMLSTVVEQSPVSVVITEPDGTIEYVNSHFTTATGYAASEAIGSNSRSHGSGDTSVEIYNDMWATITAGRRWRGELRNRRKDGELRWEDVVIAPIINDEGQIAHYVAIKEDVTERRDLQDKLRQTNAELEQFAYVASHDLRQPLRMVTSYLRLIERKFGSDIDEETKTFIGFAVNGAKRMDRLILDLLEYSRTGKAGEWAAVALAEVIADGQANVMVAIGESDAEIIVADGLPIVLGDRTELTRLFQNLIGNAVKYCAPDRRPKVEIACRREGREWLVAVKDNGIGIAAEDRERAFAIFQRLVAREDYEGTGIGLAVCKKIAEHHGGRIWIESQVGVGSTFVIALPAGTIYPGDYPKV